MCLYHYFDLLYINSPLWHFFKTSIQKICHFLFGWPNDHTFRRNAGASDDVAKKISDLYQVRPVGARPVQLPQVNAVNKGH